ncbi:4-hydroxy-3-methylbut-2-enyl diphosphate reductase [Pantoea sp. Mhis]|uniref:4-hydroxy-3-methylbut-2-enyl diphosphate reductase n=1 Tax=Pantoea sp. Mhis TaxID=2576759 RepID=UPI00135B6509|nr:4-hydroxy-3-methylbut-2-enyl diphosphate reductase [Pantoea sp. Mhis]MXP56472.1 4-hydroxy-3-methylbut-2-enyl diphosphate reductase [Pantoea sp. Mhis]
MEIILANPRGFCAGVNRAINIVIRALNIYGKPVYVLNDIVHNYYVVNTLCSYGAIFVQELREVPDKAILIFSAHGVSEIVRKEAKSRNLTMLFDATCPLVAKVHIEVTQASRQDMEVIFIGHAGHPEVKGSMGQYNNPNGGIYLLESSKNIFSLKVKNENKLCFVTQTTLSVDDTLNIIRLLKQRFPTITGPRHSDICYATTNRQRAVQLLSQQCDLILVLGSKHSSNSNRLMELAKNICKFAELIESVDDIQIKWIKNIKYIGLTAGASVPDILVQQVIEYFCSIGGVKVIRELMGNKENFVFKLPKQLCIKVHKI